jgi:hypothetical protein
MWEIFVQGPILGIGGDAQYVILQKYFSHLSLIIYFFATPPIKLKQGPQTDGDY